MVAILAFSGILGALMSTIMVPLISELPHYLNTSANSASWVITATLMSAAVSTPLSGRLGDMYGKRRVLLACMAILAVGCLVCAVADNLAWFVAGRVLQGTATSVIPLGIAILRDELRTNRLPTAIALISATMGAGASAALPLSAFLAQNYDWHLMFVASAVIAVICMVLVRMFIPESPMRMPVPFDYVGALGLAFGLVLFLVPITKASVWGWGSAPVLSMLASCIAVVGAWAWYELRRQHPVVDLHTSLSRPVLLTNIASVMAGVAMFANNIILPQLIQAPGGTGYGLGQTMVVAGLVMAPGGFVMMLVSPLAGRLSNTYGPKVTMMVGLSIIAVAYTSAQFAMASVWHLLIVTAVNGAGMGLAFAGMPSLIMANVPEGESAAANGLNTLMRSIGTSLVSAFMAMLFTSMAQTFNAIEYPSHLAFRLGFACGAAAAVIGLLVSAFIPSQHPLRRESGKAGRGRTRVLRQTPERSR